LSKNELINEIVDRELTMFLSVPAEGEAPCREAPDAFRMHRNAQFSTWSPDTLRSYLNDLVAAEINGRNLMTYKYARMDELIPSENTSKLLDLIVTLQLNWQRQVLEEYPKLAKTGRCLTD
jgi:uncharacterized protein YpmS